MIKKILIFTVIINSFLFATNTENTKKNRINKQIQIEMEKEKKYSIEQKFYNHNDYDYKGSEINPESLKSIKAIEVDDLDMDNVYY